MVWGLTAGFTVAVLVGICSTQWFWRRAGPAAPGRDYFDALDERPYAAAGGAEGLGRAHEGQSGPPLLTPVADGVFELVAPEPDDLHERCFQLFRSDANRTLAAKAADLDARWRAGNLSAPCVWSRRMAVVKLREGALVYSPLECSEERAAAVRALGGAKIIVLPSFEKATHFEGWHRAFPEAAVVTVAGSKNARVLQQIPRKRLVVLSSGRVLQPGARRLLADFDVEVVNEAALEDEILLHHRPSRSLLVADFVLFGSPEKEDPRGWPRLGSEKWTHLYYLFHLRFTPHLMPVYRMGLSKKQKGVALASLERVLAWRAERVLSAHAGMVSDGGAERAAELLRRSWRWCNATKRR